MNTYISRHAFKLSVVRQNFVTQEKQRIYIEKERERERNRERETETERERERDRERGGRDREEGETERERAERERERERGMNQEMGRRATALSELILIFYSVCVLFF